MSNSINFNEWNLITECAHLLNSDNKKAEANRKIIECLEYIKTHGTQYIQLFFYWPLPFYYQNLINVHILLLNSIR